MKKKLSTGDIIFEVCLVVFMVIFCVVTLYPVLNQLAVSFNDGFDSVTTRVHLWPHKFSLDNYKTVLAKPNLRRGAIVTVGRTVVGTLISLFFNALLAFVVSRKRFLFKKGVNLFWVITMYVNGGLIPGYILIQKLQKLIFSCRLVEATQRLTTSASRTLFGSAPSAGTKAVPSTRQYMGSCCVIPSPSACTMRSGCSSV